MYIRCAIRHFFYFSYGLAILTVDTRNCISLKANKSPAAAGPKAHKKSSREEKESTLAQFVARSQTDMIKLRRIPGIFRGAACAADPKWQNFCVLQQQPIASLYDIPDVSPPTIAADMAAFAEQVSDSPLHLNNE